MIDGRAFARHAAALDRIKTAPTLHGAGRRHRRRLRWAASCGRPLVECTDPAHEVFTTEYFGPILGVHVYDDARFDERGRAGRVGRAVRADRLDLRHRPPGRRRRAASALRYAAGNFYINDKPTGAVVGQQPFGGARASGTNDKAGSLAQPAPLGLAADDQGDLRAADRPRVPAHGLTGGTEPACPCGGASCRRPPADAV